MTSHDPIWIIHFIQTFRVPVRSLSAFLSHQKNMQTMFSSHIKNCLSMWSALYVFVYPFCASKVTIWAWQPKSDSCGVTADTQALTRTRGLSISECRQDTGCILCCPQDRTRAIDLWPTGHFKSLSSRLRAWTNPCCVYYTTGTTAGWSVCSLAGTSWYAHTYGYYLGWCALIWISTNGHRGGISAHTV